MQRSEMHFLFKIPSGTLLLEAQLLYKRAVLTLVILLQVAEMRATVSDHLQESAAGVKILLILLEVARKLLDLAGKDTDLDCG